MWLLEGAPLLALGSLWVHGEQKGERRKQSAVTTAPLGQDPRPGDLQ